MLTLQHRSHSLLFCSALDIQAMSLGEPTLSGGTLPLSRWLGALWGPGLLNSGELCPIHCGLSEVGASSSSVRIFALSN